MNDPLRVALIGVAAGTAGAFLPGIIGIFVLIAGAVLAGWVLPTAPMKAAAFFVLPTALLGAARVVVDDEADALPSLLIGVVVALVLAAVFTHVGAGAALRRQQP